MTDPFGGFTTQTPGGSGTPAPRLQFQGQYQDPLTGNYYLRARDYTPGTGGFTTVDPLAKSNSAGATSPYAFGDGNPLTTTDPSGMCGGLFSVVCSAASAVVHTATAVVNTVTTAVTTVVKDTVKVVDNTISDLKQAANNVINKAKQVTSTVVHTVSTGVKAAAHWVDQHKAEIAGIAAGIVAGAVCEALTAGAGSIGCAALAGALGNMLQYAVATPPGQWSAGGFLKTGAEGALSGAIGGVAGKFLGPAVKGLGGKLFGKAVDAAEEGAEGAAAREGADAVEGNTSQFASKASDTDPAAADSESSLSESAGPSCSFDPTTRPTARGRKRALRRCDYGGITGD